MILPGKDKAAKAGDGKEMMAAVRGWCAQIHGSRLSTGREG